MVKVESFRACEDGSGAVAVIASGRWVYSFTLAGQESCWAISAPSYGFVSKRERETAYNRAAAEFRRLTSALSPQWHQMRREMYAA